MSFVNPPGELPNINDCQFYHGIDLPGVGFVGTGWDLRKTVDAYLGNISFKKKSVLDVGAAGGYLTFEMEKRGADVVSFDMESGSHWNVVPFANERFDLQKTRESSVESHRRLENAYWFAHKKLGSKARRYAGSVYDMPAELGTYDIVFFGMILPHLRDPFQALYNGSLHCKDQLVVTQQTFQAAEPMMKFMPDPTTNQPDRAWWLMSDAIVERWFNVLGFKLVDSISEMHYAIARSKSVPCTAFIGKRVDSLK